MEQNRVDWDQHFAALKDGDCDIGIDVLLWVLESTGVPRTTDTTQTDSGFG